MKTHSPSRFRFPLAAIAGAVAGALALATGGAPAAPINTKGIPTGAQAIVHLDLDAGRKSALAPLIEKEISKKDSGVKVSAVPEWTKDAGFKAEDITSVTFGVFSAGEGKDPNSVAVVRGKIPFAQLHDYARSKKLPTVAVGQSIFYDVSTLEKTGEGADAKKTKEFVCPYNHSTFIFVSDAALAPRAVAALKGGSAAVTAPAALVSVGATAGTPILLAHIDGATLPKVDPAQTMGVKAPKTTLIALADDGTNIKFRLHGDYASAQEAEETKNALTGLLGMAQMFIANGAKPGPDGAPDPKAAADAAKVRKIIGRVKLSNEGAAVKVTLDYPTQDAIAEIKAAQSK